VNQGRQQDLELPDEFRRVDCDVSDGQEEQPYNGSDRRVGDRQQEGGGVVTEGDRRHDICERRSGWDRRRGPGRRRSDERRSAEEGEMNDEQIAFLQAIDEYKQANKRPFPTFTEILEVAKALGYRKVAEPQPLNRPGADQE
jgi:hypothetical protein